MKTCFLTLAALIFSNYCIAQTNTFPANGNAGIGTINPEAKLQINSGPGNSTLRAVGVNAYISIDNVGSGESYYQANSAHRFQGLNNLEHFTIMGNGNVGIGTSSPQVKLEVSGQISSFNTGIGQTDVLTSPKNFANFGSNTHGSVLISSNLYLSGNDDLKVARTHGSMAGSAILMPGNSMSNQGSILFYTKPPGPVSANSAFSNQIAMSINPEGNIGIGVLSAEDKLSVKGRIRAQEVKVEAANWPDYVFAKDYKFASLSETEKHVKEKGHLPGIPSAAEVAANGVELGEMNRKLLEKIEELTLHLIEKEKEIKQERQINASQESRIKQIEELLKVSSLKEKTNTGHL